MVGEPCRSTSSRPSAPGHRRDHGDLIAAVQGRSRRCGRAVHPKSARRQHCCERGTVAGADLADQLGHCGAGTGADDRPWYPSRFACAREEKHGHGPRGAIGCRARRGASGPLAVRAISWRHGLEATAVPGLPGPSRGSAWTVGRSSGMAPAVFRDGSGGLPGWLRRSAEMAPAVCRDGSGGLPRWLG
jgi:hypothetical protein